MSTVCSQLLIATIHLAYKHHQIQGTAYVKSHKTLHLLPESVNSAPLEVASEQLVVAVSLLIQELGSQVFQQVAVLLHLHSKSFQRPFLWWQLAIHIGLQQYKSESVILALASKQT